MIRIPIPKELNHKFLIIKYENKTQKSKIIEMRDATCIVNSLIKILNYKLNFSNRL